MLKISKLLEESPHLNNPDLNGSLIKKMVNGKYIRDTRNEKAANIQINRDLLAEKLRYLRKARDNARSNNKNYKANLVDNISRSLTNTPQGDPTLKTMINSTLKPLNLKNIGKRIHNKYTFENRLRNMQVLDKDERSDALTFKPKTTTMPYEKIDTFQNDLYDHANDIHRMPNNKLNNYMDNNDLDQIKTTLRERNDRIPFNDNIFEMYKHRPRAASTIRERNNLIKPDPAISPRLQKFYNLNKEEFLNSHVSNGRGF